METTTFVPVAIRALGVDDLDSVVAIDAEQQGRSRRVYIERRVQAALREPTLHAQLAAVDDKGFAGFMLGRVLEGEFGLSDTALRLELLGVRTDARGRGAGTQLFEALLLWARRHDVPRVAHGSVVARHPTAALDGGHALRARADDHRRTRGRARGRRQAAAAERRAVALEKGDGPGHEIDFGARETMISSASRAAMPTCAPWCRPTWATSCASIVPSPVASAAATSAGA